MAYFSDEQLDFIHEMSNIGACNATGAFSQLLECNVDVKIPKSYLFSPSSVPAALAGFFPSYVSAIMKLIGDIDGYMLFLVPKEHASLLTGLAARTVPGYKSDDTEHKFSIIGEIGNILTGTFLRMIHTFCKVSIYHTVPELETDAIFSIIDNITKRMNGEKTTIVLIENEFCISENFINIKAFLTLMIKDTSAVKLAGSIDAARKNAGIF